MSLFIRTALEPRSTNPSVRTCTIFVRSRRILVRFFDLGTSFQAQMRCLQEYEQKHEHGSDEKYVDEETIDDPSKHLPFLSDRGMMFLLLVPAFALDDQSIQIMGRVVGARVLA